MASTTRRRSTLTGRPIDPGVQYGETRSAMSSHSSSLMSPCVVRQVWAAVTESDSIPNATRSLDPQDGYLSVGLPIVSEQTLRVVQTLRHPHQPVVVSISHPAAVE